MRVMRAMSLTAALVLAVAMQVACGAQEAKNGVTVTGCGKVEAKPDVAYITLYVRADGILMTDAAEKAKQAAAQVVKAINEKHKDIEAVAIQDVQVGQKNADYWSSERKEEVRPEIVKRLRITLPPRPALGFEVIDTALRAGAVLQGSSSAPSMQDCVGVLVYGLRAASAQEDEARQLAVKDAKSNADKTAALVGKSVGDVIAVQSMSDMFGGTMFRYGSSQPDLPAKYFGLDPDKVEVNVSLCVSYEFSKK